MLLQTPCVVFADRTRIVQRANGGLVTLVVVTNQAAHTFGRRHTLKPPSTILDGQRRHKSSKGIRRGRMSDLTHEEYRSFWNAMDEDERQRVRNKAQWEHLTPWAVLEEWPSMIPERLRHPEREQCLRKALALARSMILSGEAMTPRALEEIDGALGSKAEARSSDPESEGREEPGA